MGLASASSAQLPALENYCGVTMAPCPQGEPEGDVLTQRHMSAQKAHSRPLQVLSRVRRHDWHSVH